MMMVVLVFCSCPMVNIGVSLAILPDGTLQGQLCWGLVECIVGGGIIDLIVIAFV